MTSERRPARVLDPIPRDIREALVERGLPAAFTARPPYQRGEYIAWINASPNRVDAAEAPEPDARRAGARRRLHEAGLAAALMP